MECLSENTVTELVEAMLAPADRERVELHTARCATCRRLISELVRRTAKGTPSERRGERVLEAGARIDRYVVREPIGRGATGAVYAAHDPELDRVIALKLVHRGSHGDRISREARALAKLAHPNVVAAFDVGDHAGDVFLAMELVKGSDLRAWMATPHTFAEVLDVLAQAGRGLAAAHAAGLVHRDFKPANVVVGADGRVRVVDFGLAAGDGGTELVGTPAYMAPEQFESGGADAASDQFAFCVALFEALHGDRPFDVNLAEEVAAGPRESKRAVPKHVRAALARGLKLDPAARFPDMTALLAALAPRRSRWLYAGLGAAAVASIAAVVATRPAVAPPSCTIGDAVWTPARAGAVHARFTASGAPYAEAAWRSVDTGMATFARRWVDASRDACEATRVRGTQSDQILSLRAACLEHARVEASALVDLFGTADRKAIAGAAAAIDGLPTLAECSNVAALLAPVPPPPLSSAAAAATIEGDLARGRALRDAAHWSETREVASAAVAWATRLGYEPTWAAALFLLGEAHEGTGDAKAAEAALRDAYAHAELGHHDILAARAGADLVFVVGEQQGHPAEGLEWAFHTDVALRRAGGNSELEARLVQNQANIRYDQAQFVAARDLYQKALDLRIANGATSRAIAQSRYNLGRALMATGDNPGGLALMQQAVDALTAALGPDHPDVATATDGFGTIKFNQGKPEEALAAFDRAVTVAERALGADHPTVARMSINRGLALEALDRHDEAAVAFDRAIAVFERAGGDRRMLAAALMGKGDVMHSLGNNTESMAIYVRAQALNEAAYGPESETVAMALEAQGALLAELGRHAEAFARFTTANAIREKVNPPDYFEKAYALAGMGDAELQLGRRTDAVKHLRRAVELLAKYDGDPDTLAKVRHSLAAAESR